MKEEFITFCEGVLLYKSNFYNFYNKKSLNLLFKKISNNLFGKKLFFKIKRKLFSFGMNKTK